VHAAGGLEAIVYAGVLLALQKGTQLIVLNALLSDRATEIKTLVESKSTHKDRLSNGSGVNLGNVLRGR
jgi:hypothetical protein